jgi:Mn2+/Fe2+ NRAMP family transporter
VLAGSAAYALGEAFKWPVGLAHKPLKAKAFYGTIAIATLVGCGLNVIKIDPVKALFWSAVVNGVVAVPIMALVMFMAANPKVMGKFVIGKTLKGIGWAATAVMALVALGMLVTWNN